MFVYLQITYFKVEEKLFWSPFLNGRTFSFMQNTLMENMQKKTNQAISLDSLEVKYNDKA